MILCDTNVLIEFYRGNQQVVNALKQIGAPNLAVSVITAGELYFGAKNQRELLMRQKHLGQIAQLPLDNEISARFIALLREYVLSHKLSVPDALIAATAINKGLPLFTFNIKDFHFISGLELYAP